MNLVSTVGDLVRCEGAPMIAPALGRLRFARRRFVHRWRPRAVKWLALACMLLDRGQIFAGRGRARVIRGRPSCPALFGFALAYNLARPGRAGSDSLSAPFVALAAFSAFRLTLFIALGRARLGVVAAEHHVHRCSWRRPSLWLLEGAQLIGDRRRDRAVSDRRPVRRILVACPRLHPRPWLYCRLATWPRLMGWIAAAGLLYLINDNLWALAALPILFLLAHVSVTAPRMQWVFYAFYPAHLAAALWGIRALIS